jgi:excisionase family DNA binding protein
MNGDEAYPIDHEATYSLREAAALARLSRERLRRAIADGVLPATRHDDGWRVAGADLAAWTDARDATRTPIPPGFLPASHVAALAGLGPSTIYRAIAAGQLRARWDGRHWLVSDADATAWIAARRRGSDAP